MLLNSLAGDTDSGIECNPRKLTGDTRVSGVLGTLQEGDTIQRDPDRLQRSDHVNLMKFNKTNCEVLHLSWGNPTHGYRLGSMSGLRAALQRTQGIDG